MKYVDEFRNKKLIQEAAKKISKIIPRDEINIMEVCGTHTQNFFRFGLDKMLPANLRLIAGPGCPVCVSTQGYIDSAIKLAKDTRVELLTFGDMLRIPGTHSTLEKERAKYGNAHIIYSALDSLKFARLNPKKKIVFLAVGFETTAPTIALSILAAKKAALKNLFFFSSLKLIPAAMEHLSRDHRLNLQGFLCPGHVSAIIGTRPYEFIPRKYGIGCCVAGFEPLDILEGLYLILQQIVKKNPQVANQYTRVVRKEGNAKAGHIMHRVFRVEDAYWRGLGKIPQSGLRIREEFWRFDAERAFFTQRTNTQTEKQTNGCRCGEVLKGLVMPYACRLFGKSCTPEQPIGPCMVSQEGACNAYYRYHR